VFGCAKRSLRSHPRINPSTQPSDVARGSRSRAGELTLGLLSGEKHCGLLIFVGAELAREGGLKADQSLSEYTEPNCGFPRVTIGLFRRGDVRMPSLSQFKRNE
jgi:hypothetical protein